MNIKFHHGNTQNFVGILYSVSFILIAFILIAGVAVLSNISGLTTNHISRFPLVHPGSRAPLQGITQLYIGVTTNFTVSKFHWALSSEKKNLTFSIVLLSFPLNKLFQIFTSFLITLALPLVFNLWDLALLPILFWIPPSYIVPWIPSITSSLLLGLSSRDASCGTLTLCSGPCFLLLSWWSFSSRPSIFTLSPSNGS